VAHPSKQPARCAAGCATGGALIGGLLLATFCVHALAQQPGTASQMAGIYTCIDERGIKRTSDRPIAECSDREQRVLNKDGSLKQVISPTLSPDERAEREASERRAAEQKAAYSDGVRRDRNLLARFRNELAHNKARESALEAARVSLRASEQRIKELETEFKPLKDESEFYRGRSLPARLRQQVDANQTSIAAQRDLIQNQEAELVRINRLFDQELQHLRKLWNGAPPGSIGPISVAAVPNSAP
jgi:hypothetical protein